MDTSRRSWRACGWLAALGIAAAGHAVVARAASFPCEKASTAVEKSVCANEALATLDEHLGHYDAGARLALGHAQSCLATDQRTWLRGVRDACRDTACLERVYLDRLAALDALQPGATRIRHLELPKAMPLVWIVPPAQDEVAAPRHVPVKPLVARGRLVDEIAGGDGFVIRSASGGKHLVVPLMFLEPVTVTALGGLARVADATYEVRGHTEGAAGRDAAFAPSRCTFVYRASP